MTYGHYVLTALKPGDEMKTRDKDYLAAGTVNWAMQVSFEPKAIAVAVSQQADLNETIDYSKHFTLHLLSKKQKEMVEKFAGKSEITESTVNGVKYSKKDDELILENTLGYITCKLTHSQNIGGHTVHFGEVVNEKEVDGGAALCTMELPIQYSETDKA